MNGHRVQLARDGRQGNSAETKAGASNDAAWIHGRLIYPVNAHGIQQGRLQTSPVLPDDYDNRALILAMAKELNAVNPTSGSGHPNISGSACHTIGPRIREMGHPVPARSLHLRSFLWC